MATATVAPSYSIEASSLAFCPSPDLDFLAAGARASLTLLRASDLHPLVSFPAFAPISRVSWSRPTGARCWGPACPAGLLAGGLENGLIAVWDPQHMLPEGSKMSDASSSVSLADFCRDDYYTLKTEVNQIPCYAENLVSGEDNRGSIESKGCNRSPGDEDARWFASFKIIDNHFKEVKEPAEPPPTEFSALVAVLEGHEGPVRGLAFNPSSPYLLASGGTQGRMIIWDVTNPSSRSIPYFECLKGDGSINCMSWNSMDSNIITSASSAGVKMWDINSTSPLIRDFPWTRDCSVVQWCPSNRDLMVMAAGDDSDLPSIQVWDIRCMEKPLVQFCENTKGVVALSWSLIDEDILLACTRSSKILMLNVKSGVVLNEDDAPGRCADIQWSYNSREQFALACGEREDATVFIRRGTI